MVDESQGSWERPLSVVGRKTRGSLPGFVLALGGRGGVLVRRK